MPKFIFTLYNLDTKKFEEVYYTAGSFNEALELLDDDYKLSNERFVIEDWIAI